MSKKIIAIGGGALHSKNLIIEKEIIRQTGKKKPNALFIPTASNDDIKYCNLFKHVFKNKLGCETDELLLIRENPSVNEIKHKIAKADLIFVGGGNTLMMVKKWQYLKVDQMLKKAWKSGTVLCGSSAGALCWFNYGHSDSWFYYKFKNPKFIRVKCLGLINTLFCPHFHGEKRVKSYENMILKYGKSGLALDDHCAIEIIDAKYRIIKGNKEAKAFQLVKKDRKIITYEIEAKNTFTTLNALI